MLALLLLTERFPRGFEALVWSLCPRLRVVGFFKTSFSDELISHRWFSLLFMLECDDLSLSYWAVITSSFIMRTSWKCSLTALIHPVWLKCFYSVLYFYRTKVLLTRKLLCNVPFTLCHCFHVGSRFEDWWNLLQLPSKCLCSQLKQALWGLLLDVS